MSISRQTTQAITVVGNGGNYATLTVHTKRNGVWTETLRCSARVGKNGITGNKRENVSVNLIEQLFLVLSLYFLKYYK